MSLASPPLVPQPAQASPSAHKRSIDLRRQLVSRTVLAFLMIVVAALGAAVAYWIARAEQGSARLHRQLTHGQMIEISLRQGIASDWGFRSGLEERQRANRTRAAGLRDTADRIRAEDPDQAGQLDIAAQQELVMSRLTGTLLTAFRGWGTGKDTKSSLDAIVTAELARLGLVASRPPTPAPVAATPATPTTPTTTTSPPDPLSYESAVARSQLPVWRELAGRIHALHHHVPLLALGVVLFVAALVCLTVADLTIARPFASNLSLIGGMLLSLGALGAVLVWDSSVAWPLLVVSGACVLVGLAFWKAGLFSLAAEGETPHPPELEPRQFLGGHLVLRHAHGWRERTVVMVIAVTVLLSSVVGFWYAQAQTGANEATHSAFASEVALNTLNGERWVLASVGGITPTLELFAARLRCAFATQRLGAVPFGPLTVAQRMLERDRDRECEALETEKFKNAALLVSERFDFDSGDQPAPTLMADLHDRGAVNPWHLYALADGYIGLAERWESKAAFFILGLTLFAIALYLLGQSVGMGTGTPALVLAVCGCGLALATFGFAMYVHGQPALATPVLSEACKATGTPVEAAAHFYGQGRAMLDASSTGAGYQKAADLLGCAVEARPDFARAQYDRSRALASITENEVDSTYTSFPTRAALGSITESLAQMHQSLAASGWVVTPRMLNSRGFDQVLTALTSGNRPLMAEAIAAFRRAIVDGGLAGPDSTLNPERVKTASEADLSLYRMLFTNLALAHLAEGQLTEARSAYTTAIADLRVTEDRELLASTLSDLNILEGTCAGFRKADNPKACETIAPAIADTRRMLLIGRAGMAAGSTPARVSGIAVWARPSRVGWSARVDGFDARKDSLAVVWSAYSKDWGVWRVVQPLFKEVDTRSLQTSNRAQATLLYDSSPSYCLPGGTYRAEFYLNGVRVGDEASSVVEVPRYSNYRSREMDVALCHPADWTLSGFRQNAEGRHLVRAFTTPAGKSAAYLFTFFAPRSRAEADTKLDHIVRAWNLLKRSTQTAPSDEQFGNALRQFRGCQEAIPGGTVLHRAWVDPDGMVHVAFVMGDFAPNGQACSVLESIGNYYDRRPAQLLER